VTQGHDFDRLPDRVRLLQEYLAVLGRWWNDVGDPTELRSYLNRNLFAVRAIVLDAGTIKTLTIAPPPAIGGMILRNVDPFENLFEDFYGMSVVPTAIDCIEQAIGVYEVRQSEPGLIERPGRESLDFEAAIERALRPTFREGPPTSERNVQDAIENILNALGVEFEREREVAPVGAKFAKPDFVVGSLDLAIEVKLAKKGHGPAAVQEEINADISAYRTKWRHLLFVVYDLGVIKDPYNFRLANLRLFGVGLVVVKH